MSDDAVTLAVLKTEFEAFRDEMREETRAIKESTDELVKAWNAAGTFIKAVKLLSTLIAAVGAMWLFIKTGRPG